MLAISVAILDLAHRRSTVLGLRYWYLVSGVGRIGLLREHVTGVQVLGCGQTSDGDRNCVALVDLRTRVGAAGARRAS